MHLPEKVMEIKNPRRILVLGKPDCDISRLVKGRPLSSSEHSHLNGSMYSPMRQLSQDPHLFPIHPQVPSPA